MFSVRGVYEDGMARVLEPISLKGKARVIVTILDETAEDWGVDIDAFADLVGSIDMREDGADAHDRYLGASPQAPPGSPRDVKG